MTTEKIQKEIIEYTKELSKDSLQEVLDFIRLLKEGKQPEKKKDNLTAELSKLDESELEHLEKELKDYKELYPSE